MNQLKGFWDIPIEEHQSEYLDNTGLTILENKIFSIGVCKRQSYDDASKMSGKYSDLQARVEEKCEFNTFQPCGAHSLNLVGIHAAECVKVTNFSI